MPLNLGSSLYLTYSPFCLYSETLGCFSSQYPGRSLLWYLEFMSLLWDTAHQANSCCLAFGVDLGTRSPLNTCLHWPQSRLCG